MDKKQTNRHTYIDIFAGCGGVSSGLHNAGWKGIFAIEKNKMAFETLSHNLMCHFQWPGWLPKNEIDIEALIKSYRNDLKSLEGKVDLVVGGPPCQGFSMAGKRRSDDKRNKMVEAYVKFISLVKPKMLFFENVYGFTTTTKKRTDKKTEAYAEYVVNKLSKLGYDISFEIVDFSEFGVPQKRKRFILIGLKNGKASTFFSELKSGKESFLKSKGLAGYTSTYDAISDLEKRHGVIDSAEFSRFKMGKYSKIQSNYQKLLRKNISSKGEIPDSHRFPNHSEKIIEKFTYILESEEKGQSFDADVKLMFNTKKRSVNVLNKLKPSPTLTTLPDDYVHYSEPRILTVREYARLQSFDDTFEFKGSYTTGGPRRTLEVPRYTQIGNAIPPLFGEQVGLVFKKLQKINHERKQPKIQS